MLQLITDKNNYLTGSVNTQNGKVLQVSSHLNLIDHLGTILVRFSINRKNYKVDPGLYAIGSPDEKSDVFVTANYKLSFDHLRKNLLGFNAWVLVLDTNGVNVWCAAGKGTFGTKELVKRINETSLRKIVNHRKLILPQLGAVGVSAHEVKEKTTLSASPDINKGIPDFKSLNKSGLKIENTAGFNVKYGPVKASDIKDFIANGYKSTKEMRKVSFSITDRAKLIPVDFIYGKYYFLAAFTLVFLISLLTKNGFSIDHISGIIFRTIQNVFLAYFSGIVLTPLLLPYIPFRSFAMKGFISGLSVSVLLFFLKQTGTNYLENISWFLIISALSSFTAMNFTGSSTYTSLSGVKKEMKTAIPFQISFAFLGLVLLAFGKMN